MIPPLWLTISSAVLLSVPHNRACQAERTYSSCSSTPGWLKGFTPSRYPLTPCELEEVEQLAKIELIYLGNGYHEVGNLTVGMCQNGSVHGALIDEINGLAR